MKYWEIIADNLSKAGWSLGWVSAIDSRGRTIWIVDAHRDDGKRFVVHADEKLTAFLELESARLDFGQSCSLVLPFHLSIPMNSISVSFNLQKEPVVCPQCGIDSPRRSRPLSEVYAFAGHCCLWRHQ